MDPETENWAGDRALKIAELIGEGGFGSVYRAYHAVFGDVAVKIVRLADASDADLNDFINEALIPRGLAHPNIVPVLQAFVEHIPGAGRCGCLVTPYYASGSLDRCGPIGVSASLGIARGILSGLAHAHERRVIHRDLKPANVLIDDAGCPVVADFGLAKFLARDGHAKTRRIAGTETTMAPEQLSGGVLGPYTDVYAFGKTWLYLIHGRYVLEGPGGGSLDGELGLFLRKCTAFRPEDRFADAARALHHFSELARPLATRSTRRAGVGSAESSGSGGGRRSESTVVCENASKAPESRGSDGRSARPSDRNDDPGPGADERAGGSGGRENGAAPVGDWFAMLGLGFARGVLVGPLYYSCWAVSAAFVVHVYRDLGSEVVASDFVEWAGTGLDHWMGFVWFGLCFLWAAAGMCWAAVAWSVAYLLMFPLICGFMNWMVVSFHAMLAEHAEGVSGEFSDEARAVYAAVVGLVLFRVAAWCTFERDDDWG